MQLKTKSVQCKCGHEFETHREKSWCEKCCRPVFYYQRAQKFHTANTVYLMTIIGGALLFLTYLFVEIIATPLLSTI